jgi:cystathionine beta-lyase/cystathionine gamma-synthase
MPLSQDSHPATKALHADDRLNLVADVAPPIHLSTTFRYSNDPDQLIPSEDPIVSPQTRLTTQLTSQAEFDGKNYVYSREFAPNATRFEAILSTLLGSHAVSYATGLAALHAALVLLNPRRISVGDGYHGSHEVIGVLTRLTGLKKLPLDCPANDLWEGDVILLETPVNPLGTAFSIEAYAQKAHSRGAYLIVDSTFAPPGLQDPFLWGADVVLHSGSKYFGGHSDMLCGVLGVKRAEWHRQLLEDRVALGHVMGNLESWLGVRSLRTLEVRVQRASQNSARLISWLNDALTAPSPAPGSDEEIVQRVLVNIYHASLQDEEWLKRQMPNGFGPVFAIVMRDEKLAKTLPSKLAFFQHATSLGGVESLIEWRALSDSRVDRKLLRISVGLEDWQDLKMDLLSAFKVLVEA